MAMNYGPMNDPVRVYRRGEGARTAVSQFDQ